MVDQEKIRNYNQKLLAVLGTILAIGLLVALIVFVVTLISESFFTSCGNSDNNNGLISGERLAGLQKDSLKKQIISYDTPILVDTVNSVYLIPVVPVNLKKAERFADASSDVIVASEPGSVAVDSYSFKKQYGSSSVEYVNMLIYSPLRNKIEKLFSDRILLFSINIYASKEDILLFFYAMEKDDNKDGRISPDDFRSLCIYSLKTQEMKVVKEPDATITGYQLMENSKDLLVRCGIDRNKDGKFDYYSEPYEIRRYNYEKQVLELVIPNSLHDEMQKIIEGN
ncbi:MAG: hypothetical protein FWF54_06255 [Candidatus Azobacteroides sp.]|nr:hypothetical protein [Candidatus Azobacteroides sp.]